MNVSVHANCSLAYLQRVNGRTGNIPYCMCVYMCACSRLRACACVCVCVYIHECVCVCVYMKQQFQEETRI